MPDKARVAVLISGSGTNMAALLYASRMEGSAFEIVLVASNDPEAAGLQLAQAEGVPVFALPHKGMKRAAHDDAMDEAIRASGAEYVALAGYMRVLGDKMVRRWDGRMLNIHPSLLPKYPGLDTHARALAAGDREHGASLHFVIPELDAGPVIAQVRIPVLDNDSADALAQRLLPREHALMVAATALVASGDVVLTPAGIQYRGATLSTPLLLNEHDVLVADTDRPAG